MWASCLHVAHLMVHFTVMRQPGLESRAVVEGQSALQPKGPGGLALTEQQS